MMRGASAAALGELSDKLGRTRTLADAAAIGEELFGVADVLRREHTLRRVLADSSVDGEAKAGLARSVFGSSLRDDTLTVLTDAVERRWISARDLADAIHQLAALSVIHSAGAKARTVSDELFSVRQLINANPELRSALGDLTRTSEDRTALLRGIVAGRAQDATLWLVDQAVASDGSVDKALDGYQKLAAGLQGARVAVVRTARALDDAEQTRLTEALGTHYGTEVHLHVVVEAELVGGLRVEIGDDVIDGTVANRLDDARRRLAG